MRSERDPKNNPKKAQQIASAEPNSPNCGGVKWNSGARNGDKYNPDIRARKIAPHARKENSHENQLGILLISGCNGFHERTSALSFTGLSATNTLTGAGSR